MSSSRRRRPTNDFRGAEFNNSAVGPRARVENPIIVYGSDLDMGGRRRDLHTRVASVREQLLDSVQDPHRRTELAVRIDRVQEALEDDDSDVEIIHSRWERVRAMLIPSLAVAASVAQITSLVNDLLT